MVNQLQDHAAIDFVGTAHTGVATVDLLRNSNAEVILTTSDWVDVMRTVRFSVGIETSKHPRIVVEAPQVDTPTLIRIASYGFDGVISSSLSSENAIDRLKKIADGSNTISEEPAVQALGITPGMLTRELIFSDDIQRSICDLLASGLSDEEISSVLRLSMQVVRNSIEAILHANSLTRRTQLAVMHASLIRIPDFT